MALPPTIPKGCGKAKDRPVFTLGRAARLLLDSGDEERAWRGTARQPAVIERATFPAPDDRFPDVHRFAAAWRAAGGTRDAAGGTRER